MAVLIMYESLCLSPRMDPWSCLRQGEPSRSSQSALTWSVWEEAVSALPSPCCPFLKVWSPQCRPSGISLCFYLIWLPIKVLKVTQSGREITLHLVAAILRMLRDPHTLPVCSSVMIGEHPIRTRLVY